MRKWKMILLCLFCSIAVNMLSGCHKELGEAKDLRKLDPNIGTIVGYEDGKPIIKLKKRSPAIFADSNEVRVHKKELRPVVKGRFSSGREYSVLLDSGSSKCMIVQEKHVRENNFSFYPFYYKDGKPKHAGLCLVESLEIGNMRFVKSPAVYIPDGPDLVIFGIPFGVGQSIVLSLDIMKEFKYIGIDDVKKEVSLSGNKLFSAGEEAGWRSYPMAVEPKGDNLFLFISIPVQGRVLKLWFDTGSHDGLTFSKEQWDRIASIFPQFNLYSSHMTLPLIGELKCKKGWPDKVNIADSQFSHLNLTVEIVEESNKIFNEGDGFIGMECFKKKTIVLDFARNLFWIK